MSRPTALDLCVGLGGWVEGLTAEGWFVIGVDIEDMFAVLHEPRPDHFELRMADICEMDGADYAHVDLIVGSSPCQDFSYRAMPWSRAKALHAPFLGMWLFWQQFRIQREACEAAGRYIPMVVENVRGAQPWVGPAAWNYGSYYLWGDVPALMPTPRDRKLKGGQTNWRDHGKPGYKGQQLQDHFADGLKVSGFRFDGSGGSFQTASVEKMVHRLDGAPHTKRLTNPAEHRKPPALVSAEPPSEGRKGAGAGAAWFDQNLCQLSSKSVSRKRASAQIAKIPFALSSHIARVYRP